MPYVKCFKRNLVGKKSIFWIALRPELEGIGKDFKKIKKSFEKVLTTSEKRDNIYLADAEKSQ